MIFGFFSNTFGFLFLEKAKSNLFFWPNRFLCRFGRFKDDFVKFLSTGRFLDTVHGRKMVNFCWKLCTKNL